MPTVKHSINVSAPIDKVLRISNTVTLWPEIMPEYNQVDIIKHEGKKIWFKISHQNGNQWVSWRTISQEYGFAYAERYEPMQPFEFMHITWYYRESSENSTLMTWDMNFELISKVESETNEFISFFQGHTIENMNRMKEYIETHD